MTTLYFHPLSNPSLYPLFVAQAAGVEFERKMVDLQTQEQKSDDYLKVNPFGRVPALLDGDIAVGESAVIARYLARKSGSDIYSEDLREATLIDQWTEFVTHHIRINVARLFFNRVIAPMTGQEVDANSVALGERLLAANLPHVEVALTSDGHLHGERLTLADIALVAAMEPAKMAQIDLSDFPVLTEWLGTMRKTDWYQGVHTHFGAEMGM